MPIEFRCTQCNKLLRTGDDTAGKQAKCPECGAVMPVPTPEAAPGSPYRTMGSPQGTASPFGPVAARVPPDSMNPYQSPTGLGVEAMAFAPTGQIRPTRIDFSETLSRTWAIFGERWLPVLGALMLVGIVSLIPYAAMLTVLIAVVPAIQDPAVGLAVRILAEIAFQVYVFWIVIGAQWFALGVVRGEEPRYGLLFSGGRYLLSIILCGILVQIVVLLGFFLLIVPGIIFAMMFLQAQLLIIDRNMGVIDAMSTSRDVMFGNKMTVFGIYIITALVGGLLTLITCGLGTLAVAPYMWILATVIYLGVTGQPTMVDRYTLPPEQAGGTAFGQSGGSPFGQPGGTPFGQNPPGSSQGDSPFGP